MFYIVGNNLFSERFIKPLYKSEGDLDWIGDWDRFHMSKLAQLSQRRMSKDISWDELIDEILRIQEGIDIKTDKPPIDRSW